MVAENGGWEIINNHLPLLQNSFRRASSSDPILAEGGRFELPLQITPD